MFNIFKEQANGSTSPILTFRKDWFGKVTQFTMSNPAINEPLSSKETFLPAELLNETLLR